MRYGESDAESENDAIVAGVGLEDGELTVNSDSSDRGDDNGHPVHRVLSFVRRSGRLDDRLRRAREKYGDRYLLVASDGAGSFDVRPGFVLDASLVACLWGRSRPLVVEVGTGQGENIVAAARSHPEVNFLAVEVYDPGVAHTMLLAGKADVDNLRIAQVNAPDLMAVISVGTVSEVWTFFPDPWPKMRHHKRRLVQEGFADSVRRSLADDGVWRIATDIEDYALHVHEVMDERRDFSNSGDLVVSLPLGHVGKGNADEASALPHGDFKESRRFDGRVLTNFERKGLRAGRVIHDFTYRAAGHHEADRPTA